MAARESPSAIAQLLMNRHETQPSSAGRSRLSHGSPGSPSHSRRTSLTEQQPQPSASVHDDSPAPASAAAATDTQNSAARRSSIGHIRCRSSMPFMLIESSSSSAASTGKQQAQETKTQIGNSLLAAPSLPSSSLSSSRAGPAQHHRSASAMPAGDTGLHFPSRPPACLPACLLACLFACLPLRAQIAPSYELSAFLGFFPLPASRLINTGTNQ